MVYKKSFLYTHVLYRLLDKNGQQLSDKPQPESKYAAKFMSCKGAAARLKVRDEIDILSSLQHPNILRSCISYKTISNAYCQIKPACRALLI